MADFLIAETNEDGNSEGTDELVTPSQATFTIFYLGYFSVGSGDIDHDGAWIFRGTGIPQGATILSCVVTLTLNGLDTQSGSPQGDWYGFAVDSPSDFNALDTHRISDHHARTTASVAGTIPASTDPYVSPSLVTIAQEIVNRAGFAGDLGFTWRNTGTTPNVWWPWVDFTNSTTACAKLTITWQVPSAKALLWAPASMRHMLVR